MEQVPAANMTSRTYRFDGTTFDMPRDGPRLTSQLARVQKVMADGKWHTLVEIAFMADAPEASISARLRDLRKERFGSHEIEREYVSQGLWRYRLVGQLRLI